MSAKRRLQDPQQQVTFNCVECKCDFPSAPTRIEPQPEAVHHPYRYFGNCPRCGRECEQAMWERSLYKAWTNATGPRSDEGKAATAKNLEGHPTPEEALRTRFNAMKHGMSARVAKYFPAKPDGYAFCTGCEVNRAWCEQQPACAKQTETFMLHHAAFEQRNPKVLHGIYADLQASLMSLLQMCIQTIAADGVKLVVPKFYTDEEGRPARVEFMNAETGVYEAVVEVEQHPLFKAIGDLLSKNGLSLTDMGITSKVIEREDEQMGNLKAGDADKRELLGEVARQQAKALENLSEMMARANEKKKRDPVLIEHDQQEGGR